MAWNAAARLFPRTSFTRYRPTPSDIIAAHEKYFCKLPVRPKDEFYSETLIEVARMFNIPTRFPVTHINDVMAEFPHGETSPGLPYIREGIRHKRDVDPLRIKVFVHRTKYGLISNCRTPCTASTRTTVSLEPGKFRLVWVYPCHMTMAEGIFAQSLITAYKSWRTPYAIWCQFAKGHMKYLVSHRVNSSQRWLNLDWSGFDATVPAWLIRDAFDILKRQLDFTRYRDKGRPTHPDTLPRLWNRVVHYFINTPMRLPNGVVRVKNQGVPSGSYFTNMVDTICNAIVCRYILKRMKVAFTPSASWFLGDDATILLQEEIDLHYFSGLASAVFGLRLNVNKSSVSKNLTFAGFGSTDRGVPVADFDKLVAQLVLPAGKDQSLGDFIIRARALQLACFGVGCMRFTTLVDRVLDNFVFEPGILHVRDDLSRKLEHLGLSHWPPIDRVMSLVG